MSLIRREEMPAGDQDVLEVLGLLLVHLPEHPLRQDLREAEDRVQRRPQLVGHVREELGLVAAGGLELPALVRDLAKESRVLDRQGRLRGKRLQQVDQFGRELARLPSPHDETADDPLLPHEGHGEEGAVAGLDCEVGYASAVGSRRQDVGDLHRLSGGYGAAPPPLHRAGAARAQLSHVLVGHPVADTHQELLARLVVLVDRALVGPGELHRVDHDAVEHCLELEGRADRLAHLARVRSAVGALPEVPRTLGDLPLEARVRLLESGRRPVELLAERLQLVAGPDLDAVTEVPRADPRRPGLQQPDRRHHPPGQEDAGEHRQGEAQRRRARCAADDRGLEGLEGLAERLLDEHQPPERRDRRVGGEELPTL